MYPLLIDTANLLGSLSIQNFSPQLFLVRAHFKVVWQFTRITQKIPKKNTKCVNINCLVIIASENLWRHVNRCSNDRAFYYRCWPAETHVGNFRVLIGIKEDILYFFVQKSSNASPYLQFYISVNESMSMQKSQAGCNIRSNTYSLFQFVYSP